jgi:hypothetical protein
VLLASLPNSAEDPEFGSHGMGGVLHLPLARMFPSGTGLEQALTSRDRFLLASLERRNDSNHSSLSSGRLKLVVREQNLTC